MASGPVVNCDFCGRDTRNKSRICRFCTGGYQHGREYAASTVDCWTEWADEAESDYSENALGPKQAEDRIGALWVDEDAEWRRAAD